MDPTEAFRQDVQDRVQRNASDQELTQATTAFMTASIRAKYSYNFQWLSRPVIQYPQDIVAMQELVWHIRPDLIIETGVAHGGSVILSASLLALLDYSDAAANGTMLDIRTSKRKVVGIDIDIRPHNRTALQSHPLARLITLVEGSSIDEAVVEKVRGLASTATRVLVILDSNHTHEHVLAELRAYAPLVTIDSYCVVFDTVIERLASTSFSDRPWDVGNNPMTAVDAYLSTLGRGATGADGRPLAFKIDDAMDSRLQISVAPRGYLRRIPSNAAAR